MEDLSKYPRTLTSKEDYDYIRENFPMEYWLTDYQQLINDSIEVVPIFVCDKVHIKKGKHAEIIKVHRVKESEKKFLTELVKDNPGISLYFDESKYPYTDLREYELENGSKKYILVRTQEKKDSKAKRLGIDLDDIISYTIGIDPSILHEEVKENDAGESTSDFSGNE